MGPFNDAEGSELAVSLPQAKRVEYRTLYLASRGESYLKFHWLNLGLNGVYWTILPLAPPSEGGSQYSINVRITVALHGNPDRWVINFFSPSVPSRFDYLRVVGQEFNP